MTGRARRRLAYLLLFAAGVALAGITYTDFLKALSQRESSLNADAINDLGCVGLFQFGEAALQDVGVYAGDGTPRTNDWDGTFTGKYGVRSLADFLADPDAQVQAVTTYHQAVWNTLSGRYNASSYIGNTIDGIAITQSGLVAAAHLVGAGTVGKWLASGGSTDPRDGNGTAMTAYLRTFAGYAVGGPAPTYAEVLAADPTASASAYSYTPPPLAPGSGAATSSGSAGLLSAAQSYGFTSAGQGFEAATGYRMGDVRDLLVNVAAMLLLTWTAYVVISKWRAFAEGFETKQGMAIDIVRAIVLTCVVLMLLL